MDVCHIFCCEHEGSQENSNATEFNFLNMQIPGAQRENKIYNSKYDLLSVKSSYPQLERHFCGFLTSNAEILLLAPCRFM